MAGMTQVIAHRGASRAQPENTLAAFRRAVELGADAIELDVRRTADDHLVVHHDASLADGTAIRSMRRADLPDHLPDLDRALDACAGSSVNIEIKNDPAEPDHDPSDWVVSRLAAALQRRAPGPRWLISSFRYETVVRCRRVLPGVRTAFLTTAPSDEILDRLAADRHDAVHPWVDAVDEDTVRRAHARGLAVNVWTCDEPARMRELIAWGVDGICTNVPDVARSVRRELLAC
jgi:glycerophosphoryl diester phosphodiesterase